MLLPITAPSCISQSNEEIRHRRAISRPLHPLLQHRPALPDHGTSAARDVLRYYRDKGCKGLGEVMPNLPLLHPKVQNLFKHAQDVGCR